MSNGKHAVFKLILHCDKRGRKLLRTQVTRAHIVSCFSRHCVRPPLSSPKLGEVAPTGPRVARPEDKLRAGGGVVRGHVPIRLPRELIRDRHSPALGGEMSGISASATRQRAG